MIPVSVGGFTRITKWKAKGYFAEGKDVYMLPNRLSPANIWMPPALMTRPDDEDGEIHNNANLFERIENAYSYYNCNFEVGDYVSFYVRDADMA